MSRRRAAGVQTRVSGRRARVRESERRTEVVAEVGGCLYWENSEAVHVVRPDQRTMSSLRGVGGADGSEGHRVSSARPAGTSVTRGSEARGYGARTWSGTAFAGVEEFDP